MNRSPMNGLLMRGRRAIGHPAPGFSSAARAQRCRGFTVLELLATITVAAILVTVGIPSFTEMVRNNRITTQTNELVTALNLARIEAVKRGRNMEVVVQQPGTGWSATVQPASGGDAVRLVDRAGSAVTVNVATVTFLPTGVPIATVDFDLQPESNCSGTQSRRIAVTVSGQITTTRQPCV